VLDAEALRRRFPMLSLWGARPLFERSEIPRPVDVVSGACLMVKRYVFESAGLFSTDYFMYAEDTDLCYKIQSNGFVAYYTNAASVIHHGGGSSKRERNHYAAVIMSESLFRFMTKYHGKLYGYLYRVAMGCASLCRMLILSVLRIYAWDRDSISVSLQKWFRILRWSIGLESWSNMSSQRDNPKKTGELS
jgi:GT2 family glycosyltransferase